MAHEEQDVKKILAEALSRVEPDWENIELLIGLSFQGKPGDDEFGMDALVEIQRASPRAGALTAQVYVESRLTDCLRQVLSGKPKIVDDFLESEKGAGTFSAKINLAYCLNIVSEDARHDLHLIRKVRNEFGHDLNTRSFDKDPVRSMCASLKLPEQCFGPIGAPHTDRMQTAFHHFTRAMTYPRFRFMAAATAIANRLCTGAANPDFAKPYI
jgi:hypothetical protein